MNWSDEKYVKLYTRQTATWRMWPWQARGVFPLLLQVANGAGLIDVGSKDPLTALSVLIMMPREVVEPAIAALLEDGTIERVGSGFLIPKYLEAQEARKTDSRKKADQRDRERLKARGIVESPVTGSHPASPVVPLQPSPAQPSPAQPIKDPAVEKPTAPAKVKSPKVEKKTDPRHPIVVADFDRAFRSLHGRNYPFAKADFRRITDLLARAQPQELLGAWQRALAHQGFPTIATIEDFAKHLPRFIGTGPPAASRAPAPVADWSNAIAGEIPA